MDIKVHYHITGQPEWCQLDCCPSQMNMMGKSKDGALHARVKELSE